MSTTASTQIPIPLRERAFDGGTFDPRYDSPRLSRQLDKVFLLMADGRWRTLEEIAVQVKASTQSISARLRDLRKPRFGSHTILRRRRGEPVSGVHEYRLAQNTTALMKGSMK